MFQLLNNVNDKNTSQISEQFLFQFSAVALANNWDCMYQNEQVRGVHRMGSFVINLKFIVILYLCNKLLNN